MADTKTSSLTALAANPANGDLFMVVDVSDTTMAATGTNKYLAASYISFRTNTETLTNKTLTAPAIADFTNATHSHQNTAGGGQLDHGLALTGLSDDDHTQYLLATGSRTGASSQAQTFTNGIIAGVSVTAPATSLVLAGGESGDTTQSLVTYGTGGPGLRGAQASGTIASPTATDANRYLLLLGGHGYDGSGWTSGTKVLIGLKSAETFSGSAQGTIIVFETTVAGGTTRGEKMRIHSNGYVGIGHGAAATAPEYPLDIIAASGPPRVRIKNTATTSGATSGFTLHVDADDSAGQTQIEVFQSKDSAGTGTGNSSLQIRKKNQAQTQAATLFQINGTNDILMQVGFTAGSMTQGFVGIGTTAPAAWLHIAGDRTMSAWGTNGTILRSGSATFTDSSTASSGTATNAVANSLGRPTFAASNTTVTMTNAATLYIANAPAAGTNVTLTNAYALWVDDGIARFDGLVSTPASTTSTAGLRIPHGSAPTSPVDGDVWTTTAGLYVRINGATVGPLS